MCSFEGPEPILWLFSVSSLFVLDLEFLVLWSPDDAYSNTGQIYDLYKLMNVVWSKY